VAAVVVVVDIISKQLKMQKSSFAF